MTKFWFWHVRQCNLTIVKSTSIPYEQIISLVSAWRAMIKLNFLLISVNTWFYKGTKESETKENRNEMKQKETK